MEFKENKNTKLFRKHLFDEIERRVIAGNAINSDFSYSTLQALARAVGAELSLVQIQQTVRSLEKDLLTTFKVMLVNKKGFGYVIPEPREQQAIGENIDSIRKRIRKNYRRLTGVNSVSYSTEEKQKLLYSTSGTAALLSLTKQSTAKALERKQVSQFDADKLAAVFFEKFRKNLPEK